MFSYKSYDQYLSQVGNKIKLFRVSKGLTQGDLEEKSGVSKRSISRLEQGDSIQLDNMIKILMALELGDNLDELIPDLTKRPSFKMAEEKNAAITRARKNTKKAASFSWGDEL